MAVYLALRDIAPDSDGRPALPEAWTVTPIPASAALAFSAWDVRTPAGVVLMVVRCNAMGGRALYAIRGPRDYLDSLDQTEVAPAREVLRLGLAGPGKARDVLRAWRWWRCDVTERLTQDDLDAGASGSVGDPVERDGVLRELTAEGVTLPAPGGFPWDLAADGTPTTPQLAAVRVRALVRPVLAPGGRAWTVAGHGDSEGLENEPDRADIEAGE